jgi:hypothetical protein
MAFIQIVEVRTSRYDEIAALDDKWEADTEGRRTSRRSIVTRDRNDPERHLVIVFFDSYESAMENSKLPETGEFAKRISELTDGPIRFHDLDVVEDRG